MEKLAFLFYYGIIYLETKTAMKKLIPIVALCFCMVPSVLTYSQESPNTFGNTLHLEMMHNASIDMIDQSGRFLGQSFTLETGSYIESISFAVIEFYSLYGHAGMLTFYADEPFGEVLWSSDVEYQGLSRFVPDATLLEGLPTDSFDAYWASLVLNPVISGEMSFRDVATTFPVNQFFEAGNIVAVLELDNYWGVDRAPVFLTFTNCAGPWCQDQVDPYEGGGIVTDSVYNFFLNEDEPFLNTSIMDLAFEVKLRQDITTGVTRDSGYSELALEIRNGVIVIPSTFVGSSLLVTDVLGRQHASFATLRGGEQISLLRDQATVISVIFTDGTQKTVKVLVGS